ncbi:hypothetical protein ALC57_00755 [Trachymyrmex cornetzi]|uniref:Uncharacterized protein n=1 Tax=Trachymyrmex cornetzi TaxID=471704 RepID=A0A151JRG4_9HYME|nr:hypothetical protein ALC57_00755 [Trachymyrmex cornetzi]
MPPSDQGWANVGSMSALGCHANHGATSAQPPIADPYLKIGLPLPSKQELIKIILQPFLLAVGSNQQAISNFYIAFDGKLLPCTAHASSIVAFDILFKTHYVFGCKYEESLEIFWKFVQIIFYGIDVDDSIWHLRNSHSMHLYKKNNISCGRPGCIVAVSHDNLGANSLYGYTESFNSTYYCRFCYCTKDECKIVTTENDKRVRLRTRALYISDIQELETGATISKGLKRGCVLNNLAYFHVTLPDFEMIAGGPISVGVVCRFGPRNGASAGCLKTSTQIFFATKITDRGDLIAGRQ